jgi:hypothetical protein
MQQWMKDRDQLIEETLAFVQGVATLKPIRIETPTQVEPPKAFAPQQPAKPKDKLFGREEIRQRVADFKATQNRFQREREEYYKETMAKVRSGSTEKLT